ncbi:2-phosphosulfolactate phosphatase [Herbiconiux sp. L3-i23]|uniref:2-phosphosulfolactate phosphatase n=1 Tax=Herbiconiux sp. L3-i23 TaxID=2905871 RepID=UPI0020661593|nr:2-phosphosulfolactate phosphatase [Herbiconiux sp. L3-i23]BDI23933.1 hypothetical protein L3i23_27090 [Herbiconiux sp. L3-i23]
MPHTTSPARSLARGQAKYQVRFEWGSAGADAVSAGADVLVIADAMGSAEVIPAGFPGPVLAATGGNREATAAWVLAQQEGKGDRFAVAVIAAGADEEDGLRFCVEDLLLAGGVIDALADAGIDYASPEAASAAAAYQGLNRAVSHILSASVTGQDLIGAGDSQEIEKARDRLDVTHVVRVR